MQIAFFFTACPPHFTFFELLHPFSRTLKSASRRGAIVVMNTTDSVSWAAPLPTALSAWTKSIDVSVEWWGRSKQETKSFAANKRLSLFTVRDRTHCSDAQFKEQPAAKIVYIFAVGSRIFRIRVRNLFISSSRYELKYNTIIPQ